MSSGLGEDPRIVLSDAAMIRTAAAGGWPIPEEKRKQLMERLTNIALDPDSSKRVVNAVAKTIGFLDRIALAAEVAVRNNKPQVVVVNNNTNNVDTLAQAAAGFSNPKDAQQFLDLIAKSDFKADIPDPAKPSAPAASGPRSHGKGVQ